MLDDVCFNVQILKEPMNVLRKSLGGKIDLSPAARKAFLDFAGEPAGVADSFSKVLAVSAASAHLLCASPLPTFEDALDKWVQWCANGPPAGSRPYLHHVREFMLHKGFLEPPPEGLSKFLQGCCPTQSLEGTKGFADRVTLEHCNSLEQQVLDKVKHRSNMIRYCTHDSSEKLVSAMKEARLENVLGFVTDMNASSVEALAAEYAKSSKNDGLLVLRSLKHVMLFGLLQSVVHAPRS